MAHIGFIGTGTISAAMVRGLQRLESPPAILVSPRSEAVSRALVAEFGRVRRPTDNAEVATADIVVLGIRPAQLEDALRGIEFRPDQIVVSLVAGLTLADVQRLAPQSRVDRVVPLPGIARGEGPITIFPGQPEVVALLRPLGDLIVAADEAALDMGGLSAFMSSYFELHNALLEVAIRAGVPPPEAQLYVASLLGMLAGTARSTPVERLPALVAEHQTKGGLNERVRQHLLDAGWFDAPQAAFAAIGGLSWKKLG